MCIVLMDMSLLCLVLCNLLFNVLKYVLGISLVMLYVLDFDEFVVL